MTISCPAPQWPMGLLEVGPDGDRSIMLRSVADLKGCSYSVLALRIDPVSMELDRRADVPYGTYNEFRWDRLLEDITPYADIGDSALVTLATGSYVFFMLPTDRLSDDE